MLNRIKEVIERHQAKKMWKEIRNRNAEILRENREETQIILMGYIQRQELLTTGLLPTIKEAHLRASIFYDNLKAMGLIGTDNKPLESIIGTLRGEDE